MTTKHIFWATCPNCSRPFLVDGSLRYAGIKLICPFCAHRFLPDDAAELDERPVR
jgi:hypothetical protein